MLFCSSPEREKVKPGEPKDLDLDLARAMTRPSTQPRAFSRLALRTAAGSSIRQQRKLKPRKLRARLGDVLLPPKSKSRHSRGAPASKFLGKILRPCNRKKAASQAADPDNPSLT